MPEMPEVQGLVDFLRGRVTGLDDHARDGREHRRAQDLRPADQRARRARRSRAPSATASSSTSRRRGPHLVFHLAKAGWLRWYDALAPTLIRPGQDADRPARRAADGSGFDLTEAGTKKSLAVYVVRDPPTCPASRGSAPIRSTRRSTATRSPGCSRAAARRSRACCATSRSSPASATPTPTRSCTPRGCRRTRSRRRLDDDDVDRLYAAMQHDADGGGRRGIRQAARRAQGRQAARDAGARPPRRDLPGLRRRRCAASSSPTTRSSTARRARRAARSSPTAASAAAEVALSDRCGWSVPGEDAGVVVDPVERLRDGLAPHAGTRRSRSSSPIAGSKRRAFAPVRAQLVAVLPDARSRARPRRRRRAPSSR